MNNKALAEGIINGTKELGGTIVKTDDKFVYVIIKKGSTLDTDAAVLDNLKNNIKEVLGLGLRVKR